MSQQMLIVFFLVHCAISVIYIRLILMRKSRLPIQMAFVLAFVPVFGLIGALCVEWMYQKHITGNREIPLSDLGWSNSLFYRYIPNDEEDAASLIPLEEALLINDANTRRSILLELLQKNPAQYTDLLLMARFNKDTEITHYASAFIMEVQREYELKLQKLADEYELIANDRGLVDRYIELLTDYINSGLLEEYLLKAQRERLDDLFVQKTKLAPEDKWTWLNMMDNRIHLGKYEKAWSTAEYLQKKWGLDENVWLMTIFLCAQSKDAEALKRTLVQIKENKIIWTESGKRKTAFFTQGLDYFDDPALSEHGVM